MSSQKINITAIRGSADKVMDNSRKCIDRLYKSMDFEAVVGSALKKFGYVYNLDAKSGNFYITAAPGYYILANWKDHVYHIHIQINQSGLSVDSIDASNILVISPYDVENCKTLFDNMIATLQKECAKYESAIKGDKGAKLLKSMINPILRKNKLTETTVEKCSESSGQFWLIKKAFGNVFLRTNISFDNYEDGIENLGNAYEKIPNWIKDLKISLNARGFGYNRGMYSVAEDLNDVKMTYSDLPDFNYSLNPDYTSCELSRKLDEKGFIYYVTEGGVYNIFMNEYVLLCRKDEKVFAKRISGGYKISEFILNDQDFNLLLDVLTWGCSKTGFYPSDYDLESLLEPPLTNVLPKSLEFKLICNDAYFKFKGILYKIDMKSGSGMSLIKRLIHAFRSEENILEYLVSDDVETVVKNYDGSYSVLKL